MLHSYIVLIRLLPLCFYVWNASASPLQTPAIMTLAWCCGSTSSASDSEESAINNRIRKQEKQPEPQHQLKTFPDDDIAKSFTIGSTIGSATTVMVAGDAGSSIAPTAFNEGGMNFAVKRNRVRTWSSAVGVSNFN